MKSSCLRKAAALILAVLLSIQVYPVRAQTPAAPKTLPEILEFDRKFCPVCKEAELIVRKVQQEYPGQFALRRMYIDEEPAMFRRFGVAIVPTQIFLDAAGKEVFRHEGVFPRKWLIRKLAELKFIQEKHK